MKKDDKIYIAGHRGMAGSSIHRLLLQRGFENVIFRNSTELDLRDNHQVEDFFENEKPAYVFLAAARVGGIAANDHYPGSFIYDNLMIQSNVIHQSWKHGVRKLLFLGSSCIYPRLAPQPLKEEYLLTGPLEKTNEAYAIAKIAGISMCSAYRKQYGCHFISVMPTNLYGPNDHYDLEQAHVLPALLRKFHEAKKAGSPEVMVWGTGNPRREFLHADDLAEACLLLMQQWDRPGIINIGTGTDVSIRELAEMISEIAGFTGQIVFDASRPDGTPRKLLDVSRLQALGWKPAIELKEGIRQVYEERFLMARSTA